MKKILLPTDFSENSNKVIAFALEAFNDEPCEFYFLHTYQYHSYGLDALNILFDSKEFFEKADLVKYQKIVEQVNPFVQQAKYSQHNFKILCKSSELVRLIKESIKKFKIDIVLVGTEGMEINTRNYLEKNVNDIVESVRACPVMAVPLTGEAWQALGIDNVNLAS